MRVAIIGSRTVTEKAYALLCEAVPVGASEIVSGGAKGADQLAARYAKENDLPLTELLPNYGEYGRAAPHQRNVAIVEQADYVIALQNGDSRGTAEVISLCVKQQKPVRVYRVHSETRTRESIDNSHTKRDESNTIL